MNRAHRLDSLQTAIDAGIALPQLVVTSHNAPCDEKFTRNGIVRTVHVIVKNTPLQVNLALRNNLLGGQFVDFNHFTLDARLVYDTDGPVEKEVDYVKIKPLDFKTTLNERADILTVELKIKVLTSQHEDMFFRAKLVALDPKTGKEFSPSIFCHSEPIKVISKPEQLKKRKPSKKRTLTDMLVETVTRIEQQQHEQQKLIERLIEKTPAAGTMPLFFEPVAADRRDSTCWDSKPNVNTAGGASGAAASSGSNAECQQLDFETAFANFIAAYNMLPNETRPEKIRKLIRTTATKQTEQLSELIDMFTAEGLQQESSEAFASGSVAAGGCKCSNCPHKQELVRLDDFYREFLTLPNNQMLQDLPPSFT